MKLLEQLRVLLLCLLGTAAVSPFLLLTWQHVRVSKPFANSIFENLHGNYFLANNSAQKITANAKPAKNMEKEKEEEFFLPTFQEVLEIFDWNPMLKFVKKSGEKFELVETVESRMAWWKFMPILINVFSSYVEIPPVEKIKTYCKPPKEYIFEPSTKDTLKKYCKLANKIHPGAFTGKFYKQPIKIVDITMIAFDLDLYEVRLYELNASVDYFVVLEGEYTSFGSIKPFLLERNKQRFAQFWSKIIHFKVDREHIKKLAQRCREKYHGTPDIQCWDIQNDQRHLVIRKFIELNEKSGHKYANDTDIILFSDADEIPAGDHLKFLKYCQIQLGHAGQDGQSTGWYFNNYPGRFDKIMAFHVLAGENEWGFRGIGGTKTTSLTYGALKLSSNLPRTVRSNMSPPRTFWGGWHLTDHSYVPFIMLKLASFGEGLQVFSPWSIFEHLLKKNATMAQTSFQTNFRLEGWSVRMQNVEQMPKIHHKLKLPPQGIPWIMKCSKERYPSWFVLGDPRYATKPKQSLYSDGKPLMLRTKAEWLKEVVLMKKQFGLHLSPQRNFTVLKNVLQHINQAVLRNRKMKGGRILQ